MRRAYVRRLQNGVWNAVSVDSGKTFEAETGLWFNRVVRAAAHVAPGRGADAPERVVGAHDRPPTG